jgi:hypothetical protein
MAQLLPFHSPRHYLNWQSNSHFPNRQRSHSPFHCSYHHDDSVSHLCEAIWEIEKWISTHTNTRARKLTISNQTEIVKSKSLLLTVVPCVLHACCASVKSLSLYNCAARELYFCCASFVLQLCWRKKELAFALPPICIWRICSQFQFVSKLVERTNVKWTPNDLWRHWRDYEIG